jgi:signal transduction histidine kinase
MERTRLRNQLHDNVSQILAVAKLLLETLKTGSIKDRQIKNKTIEYILLAIEEIRKLSDELVTTAWKGKEISAKGAYRH